MILTISEIAGWESWKIDYVLAFSQAPIDQDLYLHLPAGFNVTNNPLNKEYVLKLEKNLYGTKQAAANWFKMLKEGLEKQKFKPSNVDPCLFITHDCIIICYVDDCLIFSPQETTINELITELRKTFDLTDEGNVKAYLGISVKREKDGTINMTQPALTERMIKALNLE